MASAQYPLAAPTISGTLVTGDVDVMVRAAAPKKPFGGKKAAPYAPGGGRKSPKPVKGTKPKK